MRPNLNSTAAYDYELPPALIATDPAEERSGSRLLVLSPRGPEPVGHGVNPAHEIRDLRFSDLPTLLEPGDLLVVNDARVSPVRLHARRESGGAVEVFVLGFGEEGRWDDPCADAIVLMRSNRKPKAGERLTLAASTASADPTSTSGTKAPEGLVFLGRDDDGTARVRFESADVWSVVERAGEMPLPPYITSQRVERGASATTEQDLARYQTVFAREPGAVAAPTAGLHFDDATLRAVQARGVRQVALTLWVGVGTFAPVRTAALDEHELHREHFEISEETARAIAETRASGGRVVAVGTTVVRALESAVGDEGTIVAGRASTRLFIRPGYRFRVVDALVTNFHLPCSTLLALVSAFGGYEEVMGAYGHAVANAYRFYSYGDAMFIPGRAE